MIYVNTINNKWPALHSPGNTVRHMTINHTCMAKLPTAFSIYNILKQIYRERDHQSLLRHKFIKSYYFLGCVHIRSGQRPPAVAPLTPHPSWPPGQRAPHQMVVVVGSCVGYSVGGYGGGVGDNGGETW